MVDVKQAMAAKSSDEKAAIIIAIVKEAQTISKSKNDRTSLTKEQFSEKILPGIGMEKNAPHVLHVLLDAIWDYFL